MIRKPLVGSVWRQFDGLCRKICTPGSSCHKMGNVTYFSVAFYFFAAMFFVIVFLKAQLIISENITWDSINCKRRSLDSYIMCRDPKIRNSRSIEITLYLFRVLIVQILKFGLHVKFVSEKFHHVCHTVNTTGSADRILRLKLVNFLNRCVVDHCYFGVWYCRTDPEKMIIVATNSAEVRSIRLLVTIC